MLYQLPNGKVIFLTIDQYLDLTDEDIQFMISTNTGDYCHNPFTDSAVVHNAREKFYDFDYLHDDDDENNKSGPDEEGFDEIIDIITPLDL